MARGDAGPPATTFFPACAAVPGGCMRLYGGSSRTRSSPTLQPQPRHIDRYRLGVQTDLSRHPTRKTIRLIPISNLLLRPSLELF